MSNMNEMMKQAQVLQKKMEEVQKKLDETEISGFASGGCVSFTLSGKMAGRDLCIKPEALTSAGIPDECMGKVNLEILEDLILLAFNDARTKVESHVQEQMQGVTGGLNLPHMG